MLLANAISQHWSKRDPKKSFSNITNVLLRFLNNILTDQGKTLLYRTRSYILYVYWCRVHELMEGRWLQIFSGMEITFFVSFPKKERKRERFSQQFDFWLTSTEEIHLCRRFRAAFLSEKLWKWTLVAGVSQRERERKRRERRIIALILPRNA